jgi:hippurate hydrolase
MKRSIKQHIGVVLLSVLGMVLPFDPTTVQAATSVNPALSHAIKRHLPDWLKLYKHLHSHPELSYHEKETAEKLASHLQRLGFEVSTQLGGHGIVGVLRNGEGPTILMRTDLDALPIVEETGVPYASKVKTNDDAGTEVGVMHACGHDIHMSVWTGTTQLLTEMKDQWKGTLVAIGQPAEEKGAGAKAMLDDGLFEKFPVPDAAIALHVNAQTPSGTVGYVSGFALANVDSVNITLRGVGGHGAYPHTTRDPVVLAAQVVLALQTIVSREVDATQPAVVTVGSIHGGTKHNIIPNEVKLQLTLRSYTDEVRQTLIESIKRIVKGQAEAAGIPGDLMPIVELDDVFTPATYNDPDLMRRVISSLNKAIGEENVFELNPVMGGEDFGRYGRTEHKVPVCMLWLGAVDPKQHERFLKGEIKLPSLHSSQFAPLPETTIQTGVAAMTQTLLDLFQSKP